MSLQLEVQPVSKPEKKILSGTTEIKSHKTTTAIKRHIRGGLEYKDPMPRFPECMTAVVFPPPHDATMRSCYSHCCTFSLHQGMELPLRHPLGHALSAQSD